MDQQERQYFRETSKVNFRSIWGIGRERSGPVTSQKASGFLNSEILIPPSVLSPQKTYPCKFLDHISHCIAFFWIFCEFRALLEVKSEFVTSQRGSKCTYFEISDFLDVFVTQKLTKLEFEAEMLTT